VFRKLLSKIKVELIVFIIISTLIVVLAINHSTKPDSLIPTISIYQIIIGPLSLLNDEYARNIIGENWIVVMVLLCIILLLAIFSHATKPNKFTRVLSLFGIIGWFFIGILISSSGLGV
jgi:hypothetical protein